MRWHLAVRNNNSVNGPMEPATLVRLIPRTPIGIAKRPLFHNPPLPVPAFPRFVQASSTSYQQSKAYGGPPRKPKRNWLADWVSNNDVAVRRLPIYVGGLSLFGVLFNRTISGIAPVADASSSQSRADLLTLGLAVTNVLTGLVWLSVQPKTISTVDPEGVACRKVHSYLTHCVVSELEWFWESLSSATCCKSLVVVYDGECVLQVGVAAKSSEDGEAISVDATKLILGSLYQGIMKSGARKDVSLSLKEPPSSLSGTSWLMISRHSNEKFDQSVILQPLGDEGIVVIGGNMIRGFTTADQAWISLIGDKLDATLSKIATKTT